MVTRADCGDRVDDVDGTEYACILPDGHYGWHLDSLRLVDAGDRRLPLEVRWGEPVALDDLTPTRPAAEAV